MQLEPLGIMKLDEFLSDILITTGSKHYQGFFGGPGHNFRKNVATTKVYKGNRPTEKPDWFSIFDENMNIIAEETKAVEKKTSKEVTDLQAPTKGYDYKDDKKLNNVSGEQFRQGYFTELTDIDNKDNLLLLGMNTDVVIDVLNKELK